MEELDKMKKILIIDNDPSYVVPLRTALTKAGYEVTCWEDGQKAMEMVRNLPADMVISEVELPQFNGHEFFKEMRSNPSLKAIPYLFISNQKRVDDRIKSIELGVDDYIPKPFFVEEVVARVDALFAELSQFNEAQSQTERGFSGSLLEMNLVDLLQTLELGKKSAIIRLSHDSREGFVYVKDGEVIDATLEDQPPEQSLLTMFAWNIGRFVVEMTSVTRERRVQKSNKELIMAGMRQINQWEQLKKGLPPLDTIVGRTGLNSYEDLSEEEKEILSSIGGAKKISDIIEQSRFNDVTSLALIKSLYQKGYLEETEDNFVSHTNNYLARLKQRTSQAKSPRERVAAIIANVFKNSNHDNSRTEQPFSEKRQLPDRRRYGRRREDRLKESNPIHLTKSDLLMIRERLS